MVGFWIFTGILQFCNYAIMEGFWICHVSANTSATQDSEYASIWLNNDWKNCCSNYGRHSGREVGPSKNWVTWGGGVQKILLEREVNPEKGVDIEMGGCHFFYFKVQLHLLCVWGRRGSKVSFITFWLFSLWS